MALSAGLLRRLRCDSSDEPLAKRLKLAENVFRSQDLSIIRKDDLIFSWLCDELTNGISNELLNELSNGNTISVWATIHRCLVSEPKTFNRLSSETKNLLIENLITNLNKYPEKQVLDEMLKCCSLIFSTTLSQSLTKENSVIRLMESLLALTSKILYCESLKKADIFINTTLTIECSECAIRTFTQISQQNVSEKKNYMLIFIEKLLFPLALIVETIKMKKMSSKIVMETQKCIKRLCFSSVKSIKLSLEKDNEKTEEIDIIFNTLRISAQTKNTENVIAAFTCLFQCVIYAFPQNSGLIDVILRKLVACIEKKELSKQVLTSLLENSVDISYNFENQVEGITLELYLKIKIEEIISKKKQFKCSDYKLLSTIAKLNPVIVEDITQNILERIIFENRISKEEEIAYEKLVAELWKASVRLRRQNKFLSKYLLSVRSYKEQEVEDLEYRNKFDLPKAFISEFNEDLKNKTSSSQISQMFHTLNFHLKTDCVDALKSSNLTTQVCLLTKTVSKFFIIFFENSSFLDSSLPRHWQLKFYQQICELRNTLTLFTEYLCENPDKHEALIFIAFSNVLYSLFNCLWYDFLGTSCDEPIIISQEVEFPVNQAQLKELKSIIKKHKDKDCEKALFKIAFFNRNSEEPINEKIISYLWSDILENHFDIISSFDEKQKLILSSRLVEDMSNSENNLTKWTSILKRNERKLSKTFTAAIVLHIFLSSLEDIELSSTKTIIEKTDFENILKSMSDSCDIDKVLKITKKEVAKQNFKTLNTLPFDKIQRNLIFLLNLPLSCLDANFRLFLFMVLFIFEQEIKQSTDFNELFTKLYLDILDHNDVDVLNYVSNPSLIINRFKNSTSILSKIVKLSLNNLSNLTFWEEFMSTEECNTNIKCILLNCIDNSKNNASLQILSIKLSKQIVKEVDKEIKDSAEIAGLRISLKIILSEKKKLKEKLKNQVELNLKNITQNSTSLMDDKFLQESLKLSLIVLSHRDNFDINVEVVQKLCVILINNPDTKIFYHFLEILKDEEFIFFVKHLCDRTKESLISGDVQTLDKLVIIWKSISRAETKITRSKLLCTAVNKLLNDLLTVEIKEVSTVYALKIYQAFVTSKRMILLTDIIVDSIFVTAEQCLNNLSKDVKLIACQEALKLCLDFLRSKSDLLLDRLHVITHFFVKIIRIIFEDVKESVSEEDLLKILAVDIEKFCTFFAKFKKDVARISPDLIANLLDISSQTGVLPHFLKVSFDSAISQLLTNCDRHGVRYLSRTLPVSTQQVFKTLYDNYVKYHKFSGKI